MTDWPILSIVTFLPLAGVVMILAVRGDEALVARNARWVALWTSLVTFAVSLVLWFGFDPGNPGFQFEERAEWLPEIGISYHMGVDGISMPFVLLSTLLIPICVLASWDAVQHRVREYMIAFLVMETMMIGAFAALDIVPFYMFFECTLIPMFLIIGIWGGPRRVYSAFKFFLYTLTGSVLMLLAILYMYFEAGTTDIPALMQFGFDPSWQIWLWLAFFASFAVKVPMWPVHTWLPDAHVEAPTAGSVILAGVMLKMGLYGLIRVALPLFPVYAETWAPWIAVVAALGAVYGALCAMAQTDLKRLVAYSSVAHLGFCLLGVVSASPQGLVGGSLQMINHGITTGALFLLVGFLYERAHTRGISDFGALAARAPMLAFFFGFSVLASIGLPGLNGFVGEFMCLSGIAHSPIALLSLPAFAVAGAVGVTLAAAYALPAYQAVFWAPEGEGSASPRVTDLNAREKGILWVLCALMLWIGLAPGAWLSLLEPSLRGLMR